MDTKHIDTLFINTELKMKENSVFEMAAGSTIKDADGVTVFDPAVREYEALISYDGTDLTVSLLKNTLDGTVVYTPDSTTEIVGTLVGAFPANKSVISLEVFDDLDPASFAKSFTDEDSFSIAATDFSSTPLTAVLRITVSPAIIASNPTVTTDAPTDETADGATMHGTLDTGGGDSDGCQVRFGYDPTDDPVTFTTKTDWQTGVFDAAETGDGTFNAAVTGLTAETEYSYRAEVMNRNGVIIVGATDTFTTLASE